MEVGLKGIESWSEGSDSGRSLAVEGSRDRCEQLLMIELMRLDDLLDVSGVKGMGESGVTRDF